MKKMQTDLPTFLQRKITFQRKIELLSDVAKGLNHLHNQTPPIIHRYLTASNVLLDTNGTARISDFGNSSIIATPMHGDVDYMSPEALENRENDDKMDSFSFGHLSLYVIKQSRPILSHYKIGGRVLFNTELQRRKYYLEEIKLSLEDGANDPLYQLIVRCLQNEPSKRPSSSDIVETLLMSECMYVIGKC